jgi:hypothetical protein
LWTCGVCDLLSTLLYYEVWYVYRSYFRFRPLPVYFPHQTFVSDVSEIPISFPFPELPFSILFPIKNMKTVMVLVFTDRFRPFSSLCPRHDHWLGRPTSHQSDVAPTLRICSLLCGPMGQVSLLPQVCYVWIHESRCDELACPLANRIRWVGMPRSLYKYGSYRDPWATRHRSLWHSLSL